MTRTFPQCAAAAHRNAASAHRVAAQVAAAGLILRSATEHAVYATSMCNFADTDGLSVAPQTSLALSNGAWVHAGFAGRAKLATKIEAAHRAAAEAHDMQAKVWTDVAQQA